MLRKLFDSITTVTGSKRTDVLMDVRAISRRATIAYNINGEEAFATIFTQADQLHKVLEDEKFDQISTAIEKLKAMWKELKYLEAAHGLSDRISNAFVAGTEDTASRTAKTLGSNDSEWKEAIRSALIAGDREHKLWSDSEVLAARSRFGIKGVPSFDALYLHFGKEKVDLACQELIQERVAWLQFQDELLGNNSPCHECSIATDLTYHNFGLARVLKNERDWKLPRASAALSALTLPTLGVGFLRGPETTRSANVLRMRLVLCKSCASKRLERGKLGSSENNFSLHPLWVKAHEAGFDEFISDSQINAWR